MKVRFHMKPLLHREMKLYSKDPGHMTKMAPYMVKILKTLLLKNYWMDFLEIGYVAS